MKKILLMVLVPILGYSLNINLNYASIKRDREGGKTAILKDFVELYKTKYDDKIKLVDKQTETLLVPLLKKKKNIIIIRNDLMASEKINNKKMPKEDKYQYIGNIGKECTMLVIPANKRLKELKKKIRVGSSSTTTSKMFDYLVKYTENFKDMEKLRSSSDFKSSIPKIINNEIDGLLFSFVPYYKNNNTILDTLLKEMITTKKVRLFNFDTIKYKEDAPFKYKTYSVPVAYDFHGEIVNKKSTVCVPLNAYAHVEALSKRDLKRVQDTMKEIVNKYGF
jgi:hypothetical protein